MPVPLMQVITPRRGLCSGVVDVGEVVDTRLGVVAYIADYAVDHTRGACGRGYLTGVEYIERQSVVGLVAGAVCDGDTLGEAKFGGNLGGDSALDGECRHDFGQYVSGKSEVIHQEGSGSTLLEVPEHHLREAAHGGGHTACETHGDVVTREEDFPYAVELLGLVLLDPRELGGGEVAGRVEQMAQTEVGAKFAECLFAVGHSAGVTPYDGRTYDIACAVDAYQPVHLIGNADGGYVAGVDLRLGHDGLCGLAQVFPPLRGVLFGPACAHRDNLGLGLGEERGAYAFACIGTYEGSLH